jgi:hypothetical protein
MILSATLDGMTSWSGGAAMRARSAPDNSWRSGRDQATDTVGAVMRKMLFLANTLVSQDRLWEPKHA